jgi:hypothetical protein
MSEAASNALGSANLCMGNSGLAAGTTTTITTAALVICIQGKAYSVAAASNGAAPTTDPNTGAAFRPIAAGGAAVFVVAYNAAGERQVFQGKDGNAVTYASGESALEFPELPAESCAVGYIVVQGGATAVGNWTFGSNNMSGVTGITYTFVPCVFLPARCVSA